MGEGRNRRAAEHAAAYAALAFIESLGIFAVPRPKLPPLPPPPPVEAPATPEEVGSAPSAEAKLLFASHDVQQLSRWDVACCNDAM